MRRLRCVSRSIQDLMVRDGADGGFRARPPQDRRFGRFAVTLRRVATAVLTPALILIGGSVSVARPHQPHRARHARPAETRADIRAARRAGIRHGFAKAKPRRGSSSSRRRESRTKYQRLGRASALRLARREFADPLGSHVWRGLPLRAGESVRRYLNDHTAAIKLPGTGEEAIAISSFPLVTSDSGGDETAVDLALQDSGSAFAPVNPLVPLRLDKVAAGGATVGHSGIRIAPEHAAASAGAVRINDKLSTRTSATRCRTRTSLSSQPSPA